MLINGFWIDDTVLNLVQDLQEANTETAGDFQKALRVLYPNHRQIKNAESFKEFVQAVTEYEEIED